MYSQLSDQYSRDSCNKSVRGYIFIYITVCPYYGIISNFHPPYYYCACANGNIVPYYRHQSTFSGLSVASNRNILEHFKIVSYHYAVPNNNAYAMRDKKCFPNFCVRRNFAIKSTINTKHYHLRQQLYMVLIEPMRYAIIEHHKKRMPS